ncbi:MAG: hypothetical protein N3A38_04030 [Planctomycetota bacterium]|nr:hypothetical protein [Planctomycetota bacterium]
MRDMSGAGFDRGCRRDRRSGRSAHKGMVSLPAGISCGAPGSSTPTNAPAAATGAAFAPAVPFAAPAGQTTVGPAASRAIRLPATASIVAALLAAASGAPAFDPDDGRIRREETFEFVRRPSVVREGDRVTISFETKGFCDVTIAVEDSRGRIVRHLASGVLGPNAPVPFQKNSRSQTVVWDGKNDKGAYVDDKESHTIRVSLGLKARYERNLMWCPKKRGPTVGGGFGIIPLVMAAAPEGVYVYDGDHVGEHVRLYDHEGNYVRTVFPFPSEKLKEARGVKMLPGVPELCPLRWHQELVTVLTAANEKYGGQWPAHLGAHDYGTAIRAMAVRGNRIALLGWRLNRLATDGSTGGLDMTGPGVAFQAKLRALHEFPGGVFPFGPRSAAFDPKGEWLYLSGYAWLMPWNQDGLHGVVRLRMDGSEPPKPFAGSMKQDEWGKDDSRLSLPLGVTCDSSGRVYVCDHMNDRIQIFAESGELLKTLPTTRPVHVDVHPRTGEIFVFSWIVGNDRLVREIAEMEKRHERQKPVPPTLTRYEAIDWKAGGKEAVPKKIASYPLPLEGITPTAGPYMGCYRSGLQHRVMVDFWAPEPTVWIAEGIGKGVSWNGNVRIYAIKEGALNPVRDFAKDVEKEDPQPRPPYHGRQRLYFDPKNEMLYVGEQFPDPLHIKSFWEPVAINPATGKGKVIQLPFDCEDMAFDMDGNACMRTLTEIARYDAKTWREVPFDYGEEKRGLTYSGARSCRAADRVASAIACRLEGNSSSQFYGMWVSPKDYVVITGCHRSPAASRTDGKTLGEESARRYEPRVYEGRPWGSLVHIFDKHGKPVYEDAIPGSNYFQGIAMDKDDFLYIQHSGMPPTSDGKYPPDVHMNACTLIKLRPGSRFLMAEGGILPLPPAARPKRLPDFLWQGTHPVWIEKAEWMYGGVGLSTKASPGGNCHCFGNSRFAFDFFARSFVAELHRYRLTVLDSNGNVILRIGRYGNADDGRPLIEEKASPAARPIGGDEAALMLPLFLATQTDRRLFVADIGNYRIFSALLGYHAEEKVALKDVPDSAPGSGR